MNLLELRSSSYRLIYRREVERGLARGVSTLPVTEADLAPLPGPIRTYLRRVGVVGRPHLSNFHARFAGRLRSAPNAGWMAIRVEQHEFFDEPTRIFLARASRWGVPVEALHLYAGPTATMQVKVASLFEIVHAKGSEMDRGETVTLFNDMCVLAPASLVDAHVEWQEFDARKVVGTFTNAGHSIRAELTFDGEGDLVGFLSNDRYMSADGKVFESYPWSTPVGEYRDYGGVRLASTGDAIWKRPTGDFPYAHFVLESIEYNEGAGERSRASDRS